MNAALDVINVSMPNAIMEYDKMMQSSMFNRSNIGQLYLQSMNNRMIVNNSTVNTIHGSLANFSMSNTTVTSQFLIGVFLYGRTNQVTVSNSTIASIGTNPNAINYTGQFGEGVNNIPGASMSGGVLAIPLSYVAAGEANVGWAVPGSNICWSDSNNSCVQMFQITDLTADATNVYIHTNAPGGGFPTTWTPTGALGILVHPAPITTFTNVIGCPEVVMLSDAAAAGLPMFSYLDQTYHNADTGGAQPDWTMWGNLQKLSATVNTAYTGSPSSTMTPNTLHSDWWSASGVSTAYTPAIIQLKSAGLRTLDATGGVPATWSGAQSGDTLTTLSQQLWSPTAFRSVSDDISSDCPGVNCDLSVTIKATTQQNVVIPQ